MDDPDHELSRVFERIETHQNGKPWAKFMVPSSGSTTHRQGLEKSVVAALPPRRAGCGRGTPRRAVGDQPLAGEIGLGDEVGRPFFPRRTRPYASRRQPGLGRDPLGSGLIDSIIHAHPSVSLLSKKPASSTPKPQLFLPPEFGGRESVSHSLLAGAAGSARGDHFFRLSRPGPPRHRGSLGLLHHRIITGSLPTTMLQSPFRRLRGSGWTSGIRPRR